MNKNYNFCIIKNNEIILYNDSYFNLDVVQDNALIDVTCEFNDKNNLIISGTPLIFEYAFEKTDISELEHSPCKKYIKHYEPTKFFKLWGCKPYDYVKGWWAYTGTEVKYIFNQYKIKIMP
jgi:hypothetical protein